MYRLACTFTLVLVSCTTVPLSAQTSPRLVVHPTSIELAGPESRHSLVVTLIEKDGRTTDVSESAVLQPNQPGVVRVTRNECVAMGAGKADVHVKHGTLTASVAVTVTEGKAAAPPSFLNEITPLFTRLGCNQGACHGKNAGQNGFKLSLRGYAPEWDHTGITREFEGRRVNRVQPEQSPLLLKPLGIASHEGGKLMSRSTREHDTLLAWIRAGSLGVSKGEREANRIEILPGNRTLAVGQTQQLLVRAEIDGRWQDVTWLARFDSNDPGMASVDPFGKVKVLRPGETAIRVSFQTQVAVVLITTPHEQAVKADLFGPKNNFVDEAVFSKLAELRIEPSGLCSDADFIRRVFLDTLGTLPTADEVRKFLADTDKAKRTKLIDQLLQRPEFVDYWTLFLGDLLQNRKERDHDVRGVEGVKAMHEWLKQQVQANKPWDVLAREVLTATGNSKDNPVIGYYIVTVGEHREAERSEVVASVAQTFLGTRIGCAQCHNHPLEKYTQDDYYHFAAFFSRIHFQRQEVKKGPTTLKSGTPDGKPTKNPIGVTQPRTGQFMAPQPLDRTNAPVPPDGDPREVLAKWITDPRNEAFSGAMVNRIWKHFLGVGMVEPVDDIRASNPPTNPALWAALNKEFVANKFDLRHLIKVILSSRTYQMKSSTTPSNARDARFYSHYYARRLPAEVLLDALCHSTGVGETFPDYPKGTRAIQLPDPSMKSYFLVTFGRSDRVTACACERSGEVTLPQLLHLQNGDSVVRKISAAEGRLATLLKAKTPDAAVIAELYLTTLARLPTPKESAALAQALADGSERTEVFTDLFWALINSKEFSFNH